MMTEGVSRRQYVTKLKYPTVISYANILPFLDAPILLFCLPFHHQKSIPIQNRSAYQKQTKHRDVAVRPTTSLDPASVHFSRTSSVLSNNLFRRHYAVCIRSSTTVVANLGACIEHVQASSKCFWSAPCYLPFVTDKKSGGNRSLQYASNTGSTECASAEAFPPLKERARPLHLVMGKSQISKVHNLLKRMAENRHYFEHLISV